MTAATPPELPVRLREALTNGVPQDGHRLAVRRVWPTDPGDPQAGYVLECQAPEGAVAARLDARGSRLLTDDEIAAVLPHLHVWQQAGGWVLAHRAHKRAVLAMPDGTFVKLAKKSATRRALARAAGVDALLGGVIGAPQRPEFVDSDAGRGWLRLARARGAELDEVLAASDPARAAACAHAVAGALTSMAGVRAAAQTRAEVDLPTHTGAHEAVILRSWAVVAAQTAPAGALSPAQADQLVRRAEALADRLEREPALDGASPRFAATAVLAHRDLHEGQILVEAAERGSGEPTPPVTFLDWDTAAWTHPALDVANLLAHVQRAAALGSQPGYEVFEQALTERLRALDHPALSESDRGVLDLLRDAARLRVFAVHAFRHCARRPLDVAALG